MIAIPHFLSTTLQASLAKILLRRAEWLRTFSD